MNVLCCFLLAIEPWSPGGDPFLLFQVQWVPSSAMRNLPKRETDLLSSEAGEGIFTASGSCGAHCAKQYRRSVGFRLDGAERKAEIIDAVR